MQKGVDVYCSTNKVIATLPRQLTLAVLWTVTLCQWFWMKVENVGPADAEKLFFLSQKYILWIFKTKSWQNENC